MVFSSAQLFEDVWSHEYMFRLNKQWVGFEFDILFFCIYSIPKNFYVFFLSTLLFCGFLKWNPILYRSLLKEALDPFQSTSFISCSNFSTVIGQLSVMWKLNHIYITLGNISYLWKFLTFFPELPLMYLVKSPIVSQEPFIIHSVVRTETSVVLLTFNFNAYCLDYYFWSN